MRPWLALACVASWSAFACDDGHLIGSALQGDGADSGGDGGAAASSNAGSSTVVHGGDAGSSSEGGVPTLGGDGALGGSGNAAGAGELGGEASLAGAPSTPGGGAPSSGGAPGTAGAPEVAGAPAAGSGAGGAATCNLAFQSTSYRTFSGIPTSIIAADITNDGFDDLVMTGQSSGTGVALPWFVNDGLGNFGPIAWLTTPYNMHSYTLAAGYLNGDGLLDMVVADNGNNGQFPGLRIYLSTGSATFVQPPALHDIGQPTSFALGDIDGDTDIDLIVGTAAYFWVAFNQGDGTFTGGTYYQVGQVSIRVPSLALGDIDNDDDLDVVAAEPYEIGVFRNDGLGVFGAKEPYTAGQQSPKIHSPMGVALADLNADDYLDIVAGNIGSSSGSLGVFLNQQDGTFAAQVEYPVSANRNGSVGLVGDQRPALADFDGDGNLDAAMVTVGGNTVSVLLGHGDGTFAPEQTTPAGFIPGALVATDLNDDGQPDLAVATNNPQNGDGMLQLMVSSCQ